MPRICERFKIRDLVSNQLNVTSNQDPFLVNPWGLVIDNNTIWVANNGSGVLTHYDFCGRSLLPSSVNLPLNNGNASPTGLVKNKTNGFQIEESPSLLLVATTEGLVYAYNPNVDPNSAILVIDNSASGAVYTGIAIADDKLYLADFHNAKITVYDNEFNIILTGFFFVDPEIPSGYAPFNIVTIGNKLYVTYAKQDFNKEKPVAGEGFGYVSVFRFDGTFVRRFASRHHLNAPWAIVETLEECGGDLLIGNTGDGFINVFSKCGEFKGTLRNRCGECIVIDGLHDLKFDCVCDRLYFTAGPDAQVNGLLGFIQKIDKH